MHWKLLTVILGSTFSLNSFAQVAYPPSPLKTPTPIGLYQQHNFFRLTYDNLSMPKNIADMGLLGLTYYADLTPFIYAGVGGYGSITGTQGGLFVLGIGGGIHYPIMPHLWADASFFAGGGGGRSSLVGGGLMLRPAIGLAYEWYHAKLGLHYSFVTFPSGFIRSKQIGLDLDLPFDFYYVRDDALTCDTVSLSNIRLFDRLFLNINRNDFAIILEAYQQRAGTKNVNGEIQDGTIGVIGAELDHYVSKNWFWWVQAGGAFRGIPNGYMDILGGLGYHFTVNRLLSVVPQLGVGAGGGGNVDTGGGILIKPLLGLETPLSTKFAARLSGGYLWAPKGNMQAYTLTGAIIYHLDVAQASETSELNIPEQYFTQGWRINLFNQTYLHPERVNWPTTSAINLIVLQFDQQMTQHLFVSYQAAFAYAGQHAGGYATGMIGPGIKSNSFFKEHVELFSELLIGAGGGGNLALAGGAIIEPVIGMHYKMTEALGINASVSQLKALNHDLNTPVFNLGITIRFGTLNVA